MASTEPKQYPGKLADPRFRTERARKASAAANSTAGLLRRLLARADELTDEQIETLRRALPPFDREVAQ